MNQSEFVTSIRGWTGYKNPDRLSDSLIMSWVRIGEERLNEDLRIADMVQIDTATIYSNRVTVPNDWIANDFLRFENGAEILFVNRNEFYSLKDSSGKYTVAGRFLIIGGDNDTVEGLTVELHYFGGVPQLMNTATWLTSRHVKLITAATMIPASIWLQEPDRAASWELSVSGTVAKLNDNYNTSTAKSGTIIRKRPTFNVPSPRR
jgi:hypothetical protein